MLRDGGANGCIKGNVMRVIQYNIDGYCVNISIASDLQLIGVQLCTEVSITKLNEGRLKLIWNQAAEVKFVKVFYHL